MLGALHSFKAENAMPSNSPGNIRALGRLDPDTRPQSRSVYQVVRIFTGSHTHGKLDDDIVAQLQNVDSRHVRSSPKSLAHEDAWTFPPVNHLLAVHLQPLCWETHIDALLKPVVRLIHKSGYPR